MIKSQCIRIQVIMKPFVKNTSSRNCKQFFAVRVDKPRHLYEYELLGYYKYNRNFPFHYVLHIKSVIYEN